MTNQWFWISLSVLVVVWAVMTRLGKVARDKAHQLVEAGAILVDVRTKDEFAAGHIVGATNVPLQQLPAEAPKLASEHKPIVVYCKSGMRSGAARRILRGAGAAHVYDLGAMSRW
jgi:rhodanese-related sulfurtransferase